MKCQDLFSLKKKKKKKMSSAAVVISALRVKKGYMEFYNCSVNNDCLITGNNNVGVVATSSS